MEIAILQLHVVLVAENDPSANLKDKVFFTTMLNFKHGLTVYCKYLDS